MYYKLSESINCRDLKEDTLRMNINAHLKYRMNCRDLKEEDILRMNINAHLKYRICKSCFDAAKGALIISKLD